MIARYELVCRGMGPGNNLGLRSVLMEMALKKAGFDVSINLISTEEERPVSEYVLGPFIASWTEPESTPVIMPGRQGIDFDTTPTEPGGKVHVKLLPPASPDDLRPAHVHAVYVSPPESVPQDKTAQWFMEGGHPRGSVEVPQPPLEVPATLTIQVNDVKPGVHYVQTILEFNV